MNGLVVWPPEWAKFEDLARKKSNFFLLKSALNFLKSTVNQFFRKNKFWKKITSGWDFKFFEYSRFLRDMPYLKLYIGHTNHPLITVHGNDVHLYPVILNIKIFPEQSYDMASRVSQSRRFRPKKSNFFASVDFNLRGWPKIIRSHKTSNSQNLGSFRMKNIIPSLIS